jgi:sporulation protein YlmC with PRC-barrel domain
MAGADAATDNAADEGVATMDSTGKDESGLVAEAYAAKNSDGSNNMDLMSAADLDGMDNIGQINEIVLSNTGEVRALVIGVGGFLGVGEQDVAVTMDQVSFASNAENRSEIYVVVNTHADMLKTSPKYERSAMVTDDAAEASTAAADRTAFVAPEVARDGYNQVAVTEVSSEMLVGKSVYGRNDNSVGTIDDLLVDDQGAVTSVIIDFGGFLGMGTNQVSVGFDELTILADEGRSDIRVYVDATKEQVQAQPRYEATN